MRDRLHEAVLTAAFYGVRNHQPLGFHPRDAEAGHGVPVLGVDINRSGPRCTVEDGSMRLGFNYVKEVGPVALERIEAARAKGPFRSLILLRPGDLPMQGLENLVMVGPRRIWHAERGAPVAIRRDRQPAGGLD
jgi:DNA polymerase III alpha subunit